MSLFADAKKSVMKYSREKKLKRFYSSFKEGQSVLDVGVSSESSKGLPARNYFLKNYRYAPETYTGLGVEDLSGMEELFPGKRFVHYDGRKFPFEDKQFDWVFSNAVIEHVGDDDAQLLFINEMMRVADNVFFTTPNKFFPVESHTDVFFLHWHDGLFQKWCAKNKPFYNKENLYLLSFGRLLGLMKKSNATSFTTFKDRLFGVPITFTVMCKDK